MPDVPPPGFKNDLAVLLSWREKTYAELKLANTRRNKLIFDHCCTGIAYGYENNRNLDARFRILKRDVLAKVYDTDIWGQFKDEPFAEWTPAIINGEALVSKKGLALEDSHSFESLVWRKRIVEYHFEQAYCGKARIAGIEYNVWWRDRQFIAQVV